MVQDAVHPYARSLAQHSGLVIPMSVDDDASAPHRHITSSPNIRPHASTAAAPSSAGAGSRSAGATGSPGIAPYSVSAALALPYHPHGTHEARASAHRQVHSMTGTASAAAAGQQQAQSLWRPVVMNGSHLPAASTGAGQPRSASAPRGVPYRF